MYESARILDANLNRAREALRVMEDVARFTLSDGDLAADLKDARQSLRSIAQHAALDPILLAAWRDTPGDVGTSLTTDSERRRANVRDVAIAAGKRAGEALRVIEECAKLDPATAAAAETKALRYRVYDLEKRLTLALGAGRARQWRLCVLLTESLCAEREWQDVAAGALRGGADCLQLREKELGAAETLARAKRLAAMCAEHGATCIINDRPDIALLARADGVHLGQEDLAIADARRIAGRALLVGVSTTNMDQARAAASDGADYCGLGPMFPTTTKHKPTLAGPEYLRQYLADAQTSRIPHLAIGGINAANVGTLANAGCTGIAVSSAVCSAADPEQACRELQQLLEAPRSSTHG